VGGGKKPLSRPGIGCRFWEGARGVNGMSVRYSEAFKRQVVGQIEQGKYPSAEKARRAYGIRGSTTAGKGIKTYGRAEPQAKRIRIETMKNSTRVKRPGNKAV